MKFYTIYKKLRITTPIFRKCKTKYNLQNNSSILFFWLYIAHFAHAIIAPLISTLFWFHLDSIYLKINLIGKLWIKLIQKRKQNVFYNIFVSLIINYLVHHF